MSEIRVPVPSPDMEETQEVPAAVDESPTSSPGHDLGPRNHRERLRTLLEEKEKEHLSDPIPVGDSDFALVCNRLQIEDTVEPSAMVRKTFKGESTITMQVWLVCALLADATTEILIKEGDEYVSLLGANTGFHDPEVQQELEVGPGTKISGATAVHHLFPVDWQILVAFDEVMKFSGVPRQDFLEGLLPE